MYAGGHYGNYCGPQGAHHTCPAPIKRLKLVAVDEVTGALQPWAPSVNSVLGVFSLRSRERRAGRRGRLHQDRRYHPAGIREVRAVATVVLTNRSRSSWQHPAMRGSALLIVVLAAAPISYAQAIILGLIQGVAELFPISSLGQSVVLPHLFGWNIHQNDPYFLSFLVATHLATALVLLGFFWADWVRIVKGLAR